MHVMLVVAGSARLTDHELTWAPMLGAFKIFLAERDRVLCWPPKTSFITAATDSRAVPALELLFPEALAKFLHDVAVGAKREKLVNAEADASGQGSNRCSDRIMVAQDTEQQSMIFRCNLCISNEGVRQPSKDARCGTQRAAPCGQRPLPAAPPRAVLYN
jgi:hypothetical protein